MCSRSEQGRQAIKLLDNLMRKNKHIAQLILHHKEYSGQLDWPLIRQSIENNYRWNY
ncbi:hypothetical protein HR060_04035 [Catenovulum sp. SM1970]|uniref:hypothetical protein n=1 Tax=Marinifaba aquimaris TaxID=2741323 RepID=UPI00157280B2|nr:hypothetical protein [Marinifaba aquimaris]NTS76029.1 hypothetical protein [Marinifaba aquimaris]